MDDQESKRLLEDLIRKHQGDGAIYDVFRSVGNDMSLLRQSEDALAPILEESNIEDEEMTDIGTADTAVDATQTEEHADFWSLRKDLSTISAAVPSFADSCIELGYDPAEHAKDDISIQDSANAASLTLMPWQVQGAAWMRNQENGPVKGGMVSDDSGTGKTILALLFLAKQAEKIAAEHKAGKEVDCRPTLVICPSSTLEIWLSEWRSHFQGCLNLRLLYGSPKVEEDAGRSCVMLPSNVLQAYREIVTTMDRNTASSAQSIVLTTYETMYKRGLQKLSRQKAEALLAKMGKNHNEGKTTRSGNSTVRDGTC